MDKITEALKLLVGVIEEHELISLSCDRDGQEFCDCLEKAVSQAKVALEENKPLSFGDWARSLS